MCKFFKGIAMGTLLGATVGVMMMPNLDRRTQRNMKRMGKRIMGIAEDTCYGMKCWRR